MLPLPTKHQRFFNKIRMLYPKLSLKWMMGKSKVDEQHMGLVRPASHTYSVRAMLSKCLAITLKTAQTCARSIC